MNQNKELEKTGVVVESLPNIMFKVKLDHNGEEILTYLAGKLINGETHEEIVNSLGVGYDTIMRVQKWLDDQLPGYEKAIEGMEKEFKNRKDKMLYAKSAIYRLKKKYPMHFLLFPTPKLKDFN